MVHYKFELMEETLECSRKMAGLHHEAGTRKLTGVYRKYNTSKFGFFSSRKQQLFRSHWNEEKEQHISLCDFHLFALIRSISVVPIIVGVAVAAAAYAGKYGIKAWQAFKARPPRAKFRKFYEGGFQAAMTRREAALILGVRPFSTLSLLLFYCSPYGIWLGGIVVCDLLITQLDV